jgi:hypothetical protein
MLPHLPEGEKGRKRGKICERLTSPRLVNSQGLIGKKLTH